MSFLISHLSLPAHYSDRQLPSTGTKDQDDENITGLWNDATSSDAGACSAILFLGVLCGASELAFRIGDDK